MRKSLFPLIVVISLLSTLGMAYFHHFRYPCRSYGYSGVITRDWRGDCYRTTHRLVVVGKEPFRGEGVWLEDRYKWVNGYWRPVGAAP